MVNERTVIHGWLQPGVLGWWCVRVPERSGELQRSTGQPREAFSNGLSFLTSYTLSKLMANVDSCFTTFASLPENKYNQKAEWTVDQSDIRNNTKISATYKLPIGQVNLSSTTRELQDSCSVASRLALFSEIPPTPRWLTQSSSSYCRLSIRGKRTMRLM